MDNMLEETLLRLSESLDEFTDLMRETTGNFEALGNRTARNTNLIVAEQQARKQLLERLKREQEFLAALENSGMHAAEAMKNFIGTLFTSTSEFSKFNSTITSASNAVSGMLKEFGLAGHAAAAMTKAVAGVAKLATEQADNTLAAVDEMNKMGAAGAHTALDLINMGTAIGLTNAEFKLLPKALQTAGTGILLLGKNVGEGQKVFAAMANIGDKERERLQRDGISKEKVLELQGEFVDYLYKSGQGLNARNKSEESLRKSSLKYIDNLQELSRITGLDIDKAKERQERATNEYNMVLEQARISDEIEEARRRKDEKEVARLESQRDELAKLATLMADFGPEMLSATQAMIGARGAFTQEQQALQLSGMRPAVMKAYEAAKRGEKIDESLLKDAAEAGRKKRQLYSTTLGLIGEAGAKDLGFSKEAIQGIEKLSGLGKRFAAKPEAPPSETDPAQDARNKLTTTTIKLSTEFEKLLAETNPLISGFTSTATAMTSFAVAIGAATVAIGALAAAKGIEAIKGIPGVPGVGGGAAGGAATTALGAASATAAVVGAGATGYGIGTMINEYAPKMFGKKEQLHTLILDALMGGSEKEALGPMVSSPISSAGGAAGAGTAGASQSLDDLFIFGSKSGNKENFQQLNSGIQQKLIAAAEEFKKTTGRRLVINSAKRSPEDQQRLWDETVAAKRPGIGPNGMPVAKPGTSPHESGLAVDVQNYNDPAALAALNRQGLYQTVPKDPVHFAPKAERGAILNGPKSGYLVEQHGLELTAPLNPESILMKLATTTASEPAAVTESTNSGFDSQIFNDMIQVMETKLNDVIQQLSQSNYTQEQLLTYARV